MNETTNQKKVKVGTAAEKATERRDQTDSLANANSRMNCNLCLETEYQHLLLISPKRSYMYIVSIQ